jgi:hypothetical protein
MIGKVQGAILFTHTSVERLPSTQLEKYLSEIPSHVQYKNKMLGTPYVKGGISCLIA